MKIIFTLLFIFMIGKYISECTPGCIMCKESKCLSCDDINGYHLNINYQCERRVEQNCGIFELFSFKCKKCLESFYLTPNGCKKVESPLDNCKDYLTEKSCGKCETGFFLKNEICTEIENPIENCSIHDETNFKECLLCKKNFVLNSLKNECLINPNIDNCAFYSILSCEDCDSNTIQEENFYIYNIKKEIFNNNPNSINNLISTYSQNQVDLNIFQKCGPKNIRNCKIFDTLESCLICDNGYFLKKEGNCSKFPQDPIYNCKIYQTPSICAICNSNYFLENSRKCTLINLIDGCHFYNNSANNSICEKCDPSRYLKNNQCFEREKTNIHGCEIYSNYSERCQKCENFHIISENGDECFLAIPNCEINFIIDNYHEHIDDDDFIALDCKKCETGFYLESVNNCVPGTTMNCDTFEKDKNICKKCADGFYLDSEKLCKLRENFIDFCDIYDNQVSSSCVKCNFSSVKFNLKVGCRKIENINNCQEYKNYKFCGKCKKYYQLNNLGFCDLIPEIENCEEKKNNLCRKCRKNYLLRNGKCKEFDSFLNINCKSNNLNGMNSEFKCDSCSKISEPFIFKQNFTCKNKNEDHNIKYCKKYKITDTEKTCEMCSSTFILSSDKKKCLIECNYDETIIISQINFENRIEISNYKICKKINIYGCEEASNDLNNHNRYICGKCKKGYYPIESCSSELTYYNFLGKTPDSIGNAFLGIKCNLNIGEDIFFPNSSEPDSNCEYYSIDNNNRNFCQKCIWGKTGKVIHFDEKITFLDCSQDIENCDKEIIFGGSAWNNEWIKDMYGFTIPNKFTCHKCFNDKIPFLHMTRKTEFIPFKMEIDIIVPSSGNEHFLNSNHVECKEPTQKGLGMKKEEFTDFPENCALGFFAVDMKKKSEIGNILTSTVCIACKNGYLPVYSQDGFFIQKCELVKNCDLSSDIDGFFNACKKCEKKFVHFYNKNKNLVDFTKCIHNASENCLSSIFGSKINSKCILCKRGYKLNSDSICEKILPHYCLNFIEKMTYSLNEKLTPIKLSLLFYFNGKGYGCNFCSNKKISNFTKENILCLENKYIQKKKFSEKTKYTVKCRNYMLEKGELRCKICEEGYILIESGNKCIPKLENCLIAKNNEIQCSLCKINYTLVKKTCVFNKIEYCLEYINDVNLLLCKRCNNKYFLHNNKCEIGIIKNCEIYNHDGSCKKCLSKSFLISTHKKSICSDIPLKQNCLELSGIKNELICNKCAEGFIQIKKENYFNKNICLSLNNVDNCDIYDIRDDLFYSTLECLKCKENYYVKNNLCFLRTNLNTNCEELEEYKDECKKCKINYLLLNGFCEEIIPGKENCEIYIDYENCELCKTGYYLREDNSCHTISSKIQNCKYYLNAENCYKCYNGYLLEKNICEKIIVNNCQIVIASNICEKCKKNYFLTKIEMNEKYTFKIDCELGIIENCSEIESQEPLTCKVCITNYYLNEENFCQKSNFQINNCNIYYSNNICEQCIQGAILSADKKSCIINNKDSLSFSNCKNLKYLETPRCSACKEGYFFKDGICISCDSSVIIGCRFCDPYHSDRCLVCKNGFNHTNDGICKLNQALEAQKDFQMNEEFYEIRQIFLFLVLFFIQL